MADKRATEDPRLSTASEAAARPAPIPCDILISNGYVVSMDERRRVFPRGAVAVADGRIVEVGPDRDVAPRFSATRVIDAAGAPVHPGFIDAHAHVSLHTTRGAFPDNAPEAEYMAFYTRWMNALEADDEYASTLLASLEMLRNGVTCFLEPGTVFEPDAAASAALKIGIRASLADPYLWDRQAVGGHELDRARIDGALARRLLGGQLTRNSDPDSLVRGHVGLYGMGTASDELEIAAKACADEHGVILTQHQSFHPDDVKDDDDRYGRHALLHLADLGVLGANSTFAHMNFVRDDEVDRVVGSDLSIVWNPGNYLNYGIGSEVSLRMAELHRRGVTVGVGTDVAKVWGFGEQGFLGYLATREKGDFLSAEEILEIATRNGARAAGLEDRIGSLEPGKRADIVVLRSDIPELNPSLDPIRTLVLVGRSKAVDTVMVDGRVVVDRGRATLVDEEDVYAVAGQSARRMAERVGLHPGSVWPTID
jgi:cytosine/adenosine deaminase-related metal-dependent hydrolase